MSYQESPQDKDQEYLLVISATVKLAPYLQTWRGFKDHLREIVKEQPGFVDVCTGQTQRADEIQGWCKLRRVEDADAVYAKYGRRKGILVHVWDTRRRTEKYLLRKCNCSLRFGEDKVPPLGHSEGLSGIPIVRVVELSRKDASVPRPETAEILFPGPQLPEAHAAPQPAVAYTVPQPAATYTVPQPAAAYTVPQPAAAYTVTQPTGAYAAPQSINSYVQSQPTGAYVPPQRANTYPMAQNTHSHDLTQPSNLYTMSQPVPADDTTYYQTYDSTQPYDSTQSYDSAQTYGSTYPQAYDPTYSQAYESMHSSAYPSAPVFPVQSQPTSADQMATSKLPTTTSRGVLLSNAKTIWIRNLHSQTTSEDLSRLLQHYIHRGMDDCKLQLTSAGTSQKFKGVATATFASLELAKEVVEHLNGTEYMGNKLEVQLRDSNAPESQSASGSQSGPIIVVGSNVK